MTGIDAHQHFWRIDRGDYGWLTADAHPAIHRDLLPVDLAPHLAAAGMTRTILVQAAPTIAETRWLLDLARDHPTVAGVVGWIDFDAPDAPDGLAALATDRKLVGIRPMVQDIADPDWLARPALSAVLDAVADCALRFDALVKVEQLPALLKMIERYPGLPVVIDHGAKPDIAAGAWQPWADLIRAAAAAPNVCCKLSGLPNEASADWDADTLRRYVDHLAATFGEDRLLWGSDWPVVEEAGGYKRWHDAALALIEPAWHDAVFGNNAARFYGLAA